MANQIAVNPAYDSKVEQLKQVVGSNMNGASIEFSNYSSKELLSLYQRSKPSRLELNFKEVPIATKFNDGYGYAEIVSIKDYYDFITDNDEAIIE